MLVVETYLESEEWMVRSNRLIYGIVHWCPIPCEIVSASYGGRYNNNDAGIAMPPNYNKLPHYLLRKHEAVEHDLYCEKCGEKVPIGIIGYLQFLIL